MDTEVSVKSELGIHREEEIPHLLFPGEMGAVLELMVKDKDGKVTDYRLMRSESFVRQFLELLGVEFAKLRRGEPYFMRQTNNIPVAVYEHKSNFDCNAGLGDLSHGIIVGTGITLPVIDNHVIETRISHGTGVGQIQYSAVTFGAPAASPTTSQFTVTRNFANASGSGITVNEIALYVRAAGAHFMIIRDVISGGILVPNGETLTVNYRLQVVI